ncbi:hypothetical protein B0A48_08172 [Cryoendolithus antarcticus]|uniref:Ribonuclease T2-like n=1 Tax=Cryoendolithus antarcticus TaxID=1507870 RepID=A0A1V8T1W2_9PEZI|nr:hypothetical protein B0A48_08172 [Cryoendolithus antarcticus]
MAWLRGAYNGAVSQHAEGASTAIADKMPSVRSLSSFALSAFGLGQSVLAGTSPNRLSQLSTRASATCNNPQLSCHNTTVQTNLCCFNAPGGSLLQTQFWDSSPPTGPSNSWTVHGLWPDNCDGTYEANCDDTRAYTNITAILKAASPDTLSYMQTYWKDYQGNDESFWEHEWAKHGTCISTLDPDCYTNYQPTEEAVDFFERTVSLFKSLPSYDWLAAAGITPSSTTTYTSAQIQSALTQAHGGHSVYLGCSSGALNELWYFFNTMGSVQSGTFQAADSLTKSTCPATGIKYLPKGTSSTPTSTRASTSSPTSTAAPGTPFSGKGYLNVVTSGTQKGCLISAGTWYTSGTCATFTATASGSTFSLSSSKGTCGIVSGKFTCGSGVTAAQFTASGKALVYQGSGFSTDSTASGSTQVTVYTGTGHSVGIEIDWQAL